MSYGTNFTDAYRQVGVYAGRISRARSPPTCRSCSRPNSSFVINLQTAKALGLDSAADAARPRRRGDRVRAARVHHAARRRGGGVAACGAGAAGRADAAHRRAHALSRRRSGSIRLASRRFCRACRNWAGPSAATCGSTSAGPPAMPTAFAAYAAELVALAPDVIFAQLSLGRGGRAAGDPHRPIVFAHVVDPVGAGFVDKPGAAGRQRHRLPAFRIRHERQMAGAAQGDRAGRDARGGPSRSRQSRRHRPIRASSKLWRRRSEWS